MGKLFKSYLGGGTIYRCSACRSHLALHDELVSKSFQGRLGRAFLFGNVINVTKGPSENRILMTGLHTVCDLYCLTCTDNIGWYYAEAFEESEKYKEGKFIVEKAKIERVQLEEVTPSPAFPPSPRLVGVELNPGPSLRCSPSGLLVDVPAHLQPLGYAAEQAWFTLDRFEDITTGNGMVSLCSVKDLLEKRLHVLRSLIASEHPIAKHFDAMMKAKFPEYATLGQQPAPKKRRKFATKAKSLERLKADWIAKNKHLFGAATIVEKAKITKETLQA